jgi:hypothetical protein
LAGLSLTFIVYLVFSLVYDSSTFLIEDFKWLYLVLVFWFGFGTARYVVIHHRTDGKHNKYSNMWACYITPWREQFIEDVINNELESLLLNSRSETSPVNRREAIEGST